MMLTRMRRARKQHACWRCETAIKAGEVYAEVKLPPGDGYVCNTTWLLSRQHADCPRRDPGPCSAPGCLLPADHRSLHDKARMDGESDG